MSSTGFTRAPSLADLGGEAAVMALSPSTDTVDIFTATVAVCEAWAQLEDPAHAAAWMETVLPSLEGIELIEFNDTVLSHPLALPELAQSLERAWKQLHADASLRGNVALEGWTRLALGGWVGSLALRGALVERARRAAQGNVDADVYLLRSLSAAMDQWPDRELETSLESLSEIEDLEIDVAFELGMLALRRAAQHGEVAAAAAAVHLAQHRFDQALLEGERPDAVAFSATCEAVATFLDGGTVELSVVGRVRAAVAAWLLGYLGENRHWRQPRSESACVWAELVTDLERAHELDERGWLDPTALLSAVGRLYSTHNSSALLSHPDVARASEHDSAGPGTSTAEPIWVSIGARLDSALTADRDRLDLVDRWVVKARKTIESVGTDDETRIALGALEAARRRLQLQGRSPGKAKASPEYDDIPSELREAVQIEAGENGLEVLLRQLRRGRAEPRSGALGDFAARVRHVVPLADELIVRELLGQCARIDANATRIWVLPLLSVLNALVRAVRLTINKTQKGDRATPWGQWQQQRTSAAPEHTLADWLADGIEMATGYATDVEIPNVAGGRADVLVQVGTERFVIEVKRLTARMSEGQLTASFGSQAAQYTLTGPPFAFLAALDLTHWTSRLELPASFWVDTWTSPQSGHARALIGFRVLGSVDTPSELSR